MGKTLKITVAAVLLGMAGTATAQNDGSALAGRWVGTMSEPDAPVARYEIRLSFGTDRHGAPVGMVHYGTLNCAGVWTAADGSAGSRFEEVITDDAGSRCAPHNDVEVSLTGRGLTVRFMEPGQSQVIATGTLRRVH